MRRFAFLVIRLSAAALAWSIGFECSLGSVGVLQRRVPFSAFEDDQIANISRRRGRGWLVTPAVSRYPGYC